MAKQHRRRSEFKKQTPFVDRKKSYRREETVLMKNRVRRDAELLGGLFTSHLFLDEPGRPDAFSQNYTFQFPGLDRYTFWNAFIMTAQQALWNKAHAEATDVVMRQLSREEWKSEIGFKFVPADISPSGKVLSYTIERSPEKKYDKFDGRTMRDQIEFVERELLEKYRDSMRESFTIDKTCSHGIGLNIVIDEKVITREGIEKAITQFREMGETDWVSETPVPADHLKAKTLKDFMREEKLPGYLMGRPVRYLLE